jgi:uroporphyrinogen-III synthase
LSGPLLTGWKIALLEARLASEAASLVRRMGGEPVSVPALREEPVPSGPAVASFLGLLNRGELAFVVLQTGVGVSALALEADRLGRKRDLVYGLESVRIVSRGPKPASALAALGLRPTISTASPHTTTELRALLEPLPLENAGVGVLHYGERNETIAAALRRRGASVHELTLYEWRLPEDLAPLKALAAQILAGEVDAVAFTTQVQVRHLFGVTDFNLRPALAQALERRVVTGAVGPTCAAALRARGVHDVVVPQNPKLGPLFAALASRLAARQSRAREATEV